MIIFRKQAMTTSKTEMPLTNPKIFLANTRIERQEHRAMA